MAGGSSESTFFEELLARRGIQASARTRSIDSSVRDRRSLASTLIARRSAAEVAGIAFVLLSGISDLPRFPWHERFRSTSTDETHRLLIVGSNAFPRNELLDPSLTLRFSIVNAENEVVLARSSTHLHDGSDHGEAVTMGIGSPRGRIPE